MGSLSHAAQGVVILIGAISMMEMHNAKTEWMKLVSV